MIGFGKVHREITRLKKEDSFLVFDRKKDHFDFPLHFHPEYELLLVSNASGINQFIGDSVEELGGLSLVLIGPNLPHGWTNGNYAGGEIQEIMVQFHDNLFNEELLSKTIMKPIKDMLARSVYGIAFSEKTALELKPRLNKVPKLDGMDYFLEMMSVLHDMAISRNQRLISSSVGYRESFENSDKIKLVYDYVQTNYSKKITLTEVSELVNMSNVSFNRFIKKRTGKTFVDYVNEVRIGFAARLLLEKDLSISEIAFLCGFNNIANFNRIFKRNKGRTPTQYRQELSGIRRVL